MAIKTTTHLNFRGNARAALAFYQSVFGGDQMLFSYKDMGAVQNPAEADQVMWGQVVAANGFAIMAYDVPSAMAWNAGTIPVFVSVRGDSVPEVTGFWEKLSEGAGIVQPLGPAGWAPLYRMLKDKFGITWVMDVAPPAAG